MLLQLQEYDYYFTFRPGKLRQAADALTGLPAIDDIEDVKEIQKDVDEIQEDVEEIQENVEEDEDEDEEDDDDDLKKIKETLDILMKEVIDLKKQYKNNRLIKKSGNEKN